MTSTPLKNCPFCDSPVKLKRGKKVGFIVCQTASPCEESGLMNVIDLSREAESIAAWNRRAS